MTPVRPSMALWLILVVGLVLAAIADEHVSPRPASWPGGNGRIVAKILGEPIHESDLQPPPSASQPAEAGQQQSPEQLSRYAGQQLARRIIAPLRDRFVREEHLEPTPEELKIAAEAIRGQIARRREREKAELAGLTARLRGGSLEDREREKLTKQKESLERSIKVDADMDERERRSLVSIKAQQEKDRRSLAGLKASIQTQPADSPRRAELVAKTSKLDDIIRAREWLELDLGDRMAQWLVGPWKFNRALYRKYGGTVIWQQAGVEAVGAARRWLEEHERAGDFEILDPRLSEEFWQYYRREDHPFQLRQPDPFAQPPWQAEDEPSSRPR